MTEMVSILDNGKINYDAAPDELFDFLTDPDSKTDQIMNAEGRITKPDFTKRGIAAIGLVLMGIHIPVKQRDAYPDEYMRYRQWAHENAKILRTGGEFSAQSDLESFRKILPDRLKVELDKTTTTAFKYNRPDVIRDLVRQEITEEDPFIISLGNGGIPSGIDNSNSLGGGADSLHSVWFSMKKAGQKEPILSETEKSWLIDAARDRAVIINDDDVYKGGTINCATRYFKRLLGAKSIYGIASMHEWSPVIRYAFAPEVVKLDENDDLNYRKYVYNEKPELYEKGHIKCEQFEGATAGPDVWHARSQTTW